MENLNVKRVISGLLAIVLVLGNVPAMVFAADETGLCEHHEVHTDCGYVEGVSACGYVCADCAAAPGETTEPAATEETKPVCTGLADCAAENHSEGCEKKAADDRAAEEAAAQKAAEEKAAADKSAADAVDALIAELPALEEIKAKSLNEQGADYNKVQSAYSAYEALTDDQKALLPPAEETFKPYFDYFNTLTQEATTYSGKCGPNATWSFDSDTGVLTISGKYQISSYEEYDSPWCGADIEDSITAVVIEEGITTVGAYAFDSASKIASVSLPSTLITIDAGAFRYTGSLKEITIPASVKTINKEAFADISNQGLTKITFVGDCPTIQNPTIVTWGPFYNVTATVYYPAGNETYNASTMLNYGGTLTWVPYDPCGNGHSYGSDNICTVCGEVDLINSGTCGTGLTWTLDKNGKLTISGSGKMDTYTYNSCAPWDAHIDTIKTVEIKNGVENIAPYAFYSHKNLTGITISDSVTSIGANAFSYCTGLTSIEIPNGVTKIENDTFSNCTGLRSIEIPNSVTSIGGVAFYYCKEMTSVVIPSSVTSIGQAAFSGCKALTDVYYESAQTQWQAIAFGYDNDQLKNANIHYGITDSSNHWTVVNVAATCVAAGYTYESCACLYERNKATTDTATGEHSYVSGVCSVCGHIGGTCGENLTWEFDEETGKLTISGTGAMADYANNTQPWKDYISRIKAVVIEDGVIAIGAYAFGRHQNLESVTIGNSVTSIGSDAFTYCDGITSITFPASVTSIGDSAFYDCDGLTGVTIPGTVNDIGTHAFSFCSSLTSVTIENGVAKIGNNAFNNCTVLENVTIPASVTSIPQGAFNGCDKLTSVTIPEGITSIGGSAFYSCDTLTSVTIPASVTSVGYSAFNFCTELQNVYYGSTQAKWSEIAIEGGNDPLTGANIHYTDPCENGHSYGSDNICSGCGAVKLIASGTCGDNLIWTLDANGVLTISGNGAMADYAYSNRAPWAENYADKITSVEIEDGVTNVGNFAFYYCENMTSVTLADSVTSIGQSSFSGCLALTKITLPDGLTTVGASAFNRSGLTSVEIPASVTSIGGTAFGYCDKLTSINVAEGNTSYSSEDGVLFYADKTKLIQYPNGKTGAYTIPEAVKTIGNSAFYYCKNLTSLRMSTNVTTVEAYAFTGCTNISKVYYGGTQADWNGITIGTNNGCLTNNVIFNASGSCGEGVSYSFFDGVLTISGNGAMTDYTAQGTPWYSYRNEIKQIIVEDGVTAIGDYAFYYCEMVESVSIGKDVKSIGKYAFYLCNLGSLSEIELPSGLATIKDSAFENCTWITSMVIPASVTSISDNAFKYCDRLKTVTFEGNAPTLGDVFYNQSALTVYYPANNSSWDAVTGKNYGNNFAATWIATCGGTHDYTNATPTYTWAADYSSCIAAIYCVNTGCEVADSKMTVRSISETVAATCTQPGKTTYTATFASPYETQTAEVTINATGEHSYDEEAVETKYLKSEANCLSAAVYYKSCACGEAGTETFEYGELKAHIYDQQKVHEDYLASEATCTEQAVYNKSCVCGEAGTETFEYGELEAHVYDQTKVDAKYLVSEATCTEQAVYNKSCSCGAEGTETFEYGELKAHIYDQQKVHEDYLASEATCTEQAVYNKSCACGAEGTETFEYDELKAHVYDQQKVHEDYLASEATCTAKAVYYKSCVCGEAGTETFEYGELKAHVYDQTKVDAKYLVSEATCTEAAKYYFSCKCGEKGTEIFSHGDPIAHTYDQEVATEQYLSSAATCTEAAKYFYSCKCGAKGTETFFHGNSIDHTYDQQVTTETYLASAATCTEGAKYFYSCECGAKGDETFEHGELKAHIYTDVVTVPTCTEGGYTTHTCTCGDSYVDAHKEPLKHDMGQWVTVDEATCTEDGSKRRDCSRCDHYETETITAPGHKHEAVVTAPTCTEGGYTTHTCICGDSYVDTYVDALDHELGQWTVSSEPTPTTDGVETRRCSRCEYYEIRYVEYEGNVLKLEGEDLLSQNTVWINGLPYAVKGEGASRYVELPTEDDCYMVTYTYHVGDANDVHTQYPTGMKVYKVSGGKITYIPELDDLLQYSGSSIRITGKKGIRMITSLTKANKAALTGNGLAGFTLVEYGTALCWASDLDSGDALVLGRSYTRSNYAYKKGVADPVFANTGNLVQYTNVLVGFTNDQCKDDIAMRPYIILEDAAGNQITLYGGTIYRSIGYIAYQNRNAFKSGTESYKYVWEIIHHVYGDKYDADYKG